MNNTVQSGVGDHPALFHFAPLHPRYSHLRMIPLEPWRKVHVTSVLHRTALAIALTLHVITAWNSAGYYSADEHFQIIAFAQAKLGELPIEHLAWEYDTRIRSSFQPWIAVGVFKIAAACGIVEPDPSGPSCCGC